MIALNAETAQPSWEFPVQGGIHSDPILHNGMLFFGSDSGALFGLDAVTGREIWKFQSGGEITSAPAASGGTVFFGSADGKVYAFE